MKLCRRRFLGSGLAGAGLAGAGLALATDSVGAAPTSAPFTTSEFDDILGQPVLKIDRLPDAVIVESIELLKQGPHFLLPVRATNGVEAITFPNHKKVIPVFLGKDARNLESLLWDAYRYNSNYKMQGLIYSVAIAAVEMGLLELLARTAEAKFADLFGETLRRDIPVYRANGARGNAPEDEVENFRRWIAESGVKAIKWRPGGRMSRNADSLPKRTERLIPMWREAFGDEMAIFADANSSYDASEAIRVGKLMQDHDYGFFEEPCEFDDLWGTKRVADTLTMPVAGGEEEYSLHRWKWMIANRAIGFGISAEPNFVKKATILKS